MKRAILVAPLLAATVASAQVSEWDLDKAHSSAEFKVSHMVVSNVVGKFTDMDATLQFDGTDLATGSVEATIAVGSVNTGNDRRDGHLKSADFFDAEQYPSMTFKSSKVIPGEGNEFQLVGDLTMRGVTKEVTFDCEFNGTVDAMGTTKAGFTATTKVNRQDYGINWNKTLDNGGLVAGDQVKITLELEFNKKG